MKKLIKLGGILLAAMATINVNAAGTAAGVNITNQATVTYNAGAGSISAPSNTVTIRVQELINATLVSQDAANVSVSSPQTGAYLKFQLTNTGNGNEAFVIEQTNMGGDDFEVTFDTIYLDDGNGTFEPGTSDTVYDPSTSSIAPDASIVIWAASDIPASEADGNTADIQVSAVAKTFSDAGNANPDAGDVVAGNGDGGTDAVYGTNAANADDEGTFIISAITVNVVKSLVSIKDNLGQSGSQAVPGADVEYLLTITVIGTGDATNIVVSDPLVSSLKLKGELAGTITVNGADLTAVSDADIATYDANTNTITVNLGTITAGAAASTVQFSTTIQ